MVNIQMGASINNNKVNAMGNPYKSWWFNSQIFYPLIKTFPLNKY